MTMPEPCDPALFGNSSAWTVLLPGDPRLLASVRTFAEAICQLSRLDDETTSAIVLSTHEAACNVIRHAHRDRPESLMRIRFSITALGVEIQLDDSGIPFDIGSVPHLDPGEVRAGGRGVFLIRTLMDEVSSEARPDGGNTLKMLKRLQSREARCASSS
jgi:serine/threonine-protein kinase RsbW